MIDIEAGRNRSFVGWLVVGVLALTTGSIAAGGGCEVRPAHAQAVDAGVADAAPLVIVEVVEGEPAPFGGMLYSPALHADTATMLDESADKIGEQAGALRKCEAALQTLPEPVSRLTWFGAGAAAVAGVFLAAWAADVVDVDLGD